MSVEGDFRGVSHVALFAPRKKYRTHIRDNLV